MEVPVEVFVDKNDETYHHIFEIPAELTITNQGNMDVSGACLENAVKIEKEEEKEEENRIDVRQQSSIVEVPIEVLMEVEKVK